MGVFARLMGARPAPDPEASDDLPERQRREIPVRLEAVGEALASGSDSAAAAEMAGRRLADDGASLAEALADLSTTTRLVVDRDPDFAETQALATAWSEATLGYLHQLSCEDPLTGLASLAHLRSRVSELYRAAPSGAASAEDHALVIVDLAEAPAAGIADDPVGGGSASELGFARALRTVRAGELARTVFPRTEPVGRVGPRRVAIVVRRDLELGRRVALLRSMIGNTDLAARVWIEGLPPSDEGAAQQFDELARG